MPGPHHTPFPAAHALLLAAAMTCAGSPRIFAQDQPQPAPGVQPKPPTPPELEPFEGRLVRAVTFRTPDKPDPNDPSKIIPGGALDASTESLARNQLRLREGSPFSVALISEDISRLNRLGRFRRVESRAQLLADGSAEIIYTVEPQPLIAAVQSVGNRVFSDQEISGSIEGLVGTPVDPTQLNRAARRIEDRYREKGYHNALVTIDQKELDQTGIVLFRIREGEKTKITAIRFVGNLSYSGKELRTAIKTSEAWLFGKGALENETIDSDVSAITQYYKDRGYLDVNVNRRVVTSPNMREAIVEFLISEGPVYTLRDLKQITDNDETPVFTTEQILGLMEIHPGDVYGDDKLKKSLDALKEAYNKLGYADADVQRRELKVPDQPLVDVVLFIKQGRPWRTGLIVIEGNTLTRDDVVRRHIMLKPDRPLDATEAKLTETRLKQTNLFDVKGVKVTLQPEDPDHQGYRDVLVQVQETNTGKFAIGAGINTDAGIVGQISLTQRNFDITDWPDSWGEFFRGESFRGGGQTFTVEVQPGTQVNTIGASLFEPSLFESNYSGSIRGTYRTRDYDWYTERRYGGEVSLGERFGSRWNASVPLRAEYVELTHVNADAPTDYFDYEDLHLVARTGISFTRSSVDNITFPSKGNRISFGAYQYFSPTTFNAVEGEYATYLRVSEDVLGRSTTVKLSSSLGYIPQGQDSTPFYERYYLGGNNFRGFDYRTISPRGVQRNGQPADAPIGGTFRFFAGAELRQPIYEDILAGVIFLDTGTVDTEFDFSKYRASIGFGVRIAVPQISPAPFAFDFGFPLLKQDTDKERLFTFTVDIPFK